MVFLCFASRPQGEGVTRPRHTLHVFARLTSLYFQLNRSVNLWLEREQEREKKEESYEDFGGVLSK